jgi:hypothetical protein
MAGQARIYGQGIRYEAVYRDVKYPRLEFKTGDLLLVLPTNYKDHDGLIEKYKDWIYQKNSLIESALKEAQGKSLDLERAEEEFRGLVRSYVEGISHGLELSINKVIFRRMKSKWGSCSSKRNLTINTLLKYLPEDLIEYVIFHELVHLIERKHNEQYWNIVSQKFEDYQEKERDLLVYWFLIQKVIKKRL